jgi:hypothetical protein
MLQERVIQVARDCSQTGIEISLWSLPSVRRSHFDVDKFYVELLLSEEEYKKHKAGASSSQVKIEPVDDQDDTSMTLLDRIQSADMNGFDSRQYRLRRKENKKRRLGTLMFYLGDESKQPRYAIAMGMYKTIQAAKKPQYTWLYSHSNMPTSLVTVLMDNSTAAVLDDLQITTYMDYNGL